MDVIPPFGKNAQPGERVEIPSYDLAENILAEQRRVAGQRRRGPGATPGGYATRHSERPASNGYSAVPDLLELQCVVAEIVARDIERLCRRPDRLPAGRAAARFV